MNWTFDHIGEGYAKLIAELTSNYDLKSSPRGMETKEIIGASFKLKRPNVVGMPVRTGRKLNPDIGLAEAAQLVLGESHPDLMYTAFPNFRTFADGGQWFHGAYGPRISPQIDRTLTLLASAADTRQAVISIWDHAYDGHRKVRDTPCTLVLQFLLRQDQLHMVTTMRSNDIWWGVPYDVFQFTSLQASFASYLGCEVGTYTHQMGSLHMYENDYEAAAQILPQFGPFTDDERPIQSFSQASLTMEYLREKYL